MKKETTIIIDIETVPDQREGARERAAELVKVPANYTKPETIAKFIEENAEKAWRNTSLDGGRGEVIIIGYGFGEGPAESLYRHHANPSHEADMLVRFWQIIDRNTVAQPRWVGHNVLWDLRFLYQRSVIHGVPVPEQLPIAPALWSPQVFDTSYGWTWDRTRNISLSELSSLMGIDSKSAGITGADVWDLAQADRYVDLLAYNKEDVSAVEAIYQRLTDW